MSDYIPVSSSGSDEAYTASISGFDVSKINFVIDKFEEICSKYPSNCAIQTEDGIQITYAELNGKAEIIGKEISYQLSFMRDNNKKRNSTSSKLISTPLVAVMVQRHVAFVAAILGILKANAAYLPIDPSFPKARRSYMFTHSKCDIFIVDEQSMPLVLDLTINFPSIMMIESKSGRISSALTHPKDFVLQRPFIESSMAYVLYTSGSTGQPKGVMVKNIGLANVVEYFSDTMAINISSKVLCLTTFCFDISMLEIFLPLTCGGELIIAEASTQKEPFKILDLMKKYDINVFQATPTTYEMLLATGWIGDDRIDFIVGGEAFRKSLQPIASNCKSFINAYGPTETSIWSSVFVLNEKFSNLPVIPIGKPIKNTVFYIVNPDTNELLTSGEEGELWIGGIGVAQGYLYAKDLTKSRFLQNPFGLGIVYRTGDIVRESSEIIGNFEFVRRIDDQVKIDGYRIELQEIEHAYMRHDLISKAVALVRDGKLIIYIQSTVDFSKKDFEDLKAFVGVSLPIYMIPNM
jgi:amino acid adenylation domain-containing protein